MLQVRWLVFGLTVLLALGCTDMKLRQDYEKQVGVTRAALVSAGDPDSLAAAALLSGLFAERIQKGLPLIARAAEEAPDRADLTWLHAQFCSQHKSCNPEPIVMNLRRLDPQNGAAWIDLSSKQSTVSDPEQRREHLAELAQSERFDVYQHSIIVHTTKAIVRTGTMDTSSALANALGGAAVMAIPAFEEASSACKGTSLEDPEILDQCRRVAAVLRRGDTYVAEMVGIAIAKRAWTAGDPQYQEAVSARRVLRYRMDAALKISLSSPWNDERASQYLQLLASHRTEEDVAVAEIIEAGAAPNPPDSWKDPQE